MLNAMHEGSSAKFIKIIALSFILLAVSGMVFMDVGGFFRGGVTDTKLAKVGNVEITLPQFERVATQAIRAQNMNLQEAYRFGLLKNILDEMVAREALRQEAQREGILVGKDEIAANIHEFIKTQIQPGETAQQTLERILLTQGLTQDDLVSSLRQSQTSDLIDRPIKAAVAFVPELVTKALARFHAERRDIVFMNLTPEIAGADIKTDEETLKAYYDTIKDQYQIPEQREFKALVLNADELKADIAITDADIKTVFEERQDQFRTEERRKIEQIILTDETKAKQASESARKNVPLKSLAAKNDYREPADIEKSTLLAELAEPVFGAEKGTILNPIKTPLGWHVIKIVDIKPSRSQTFDEVKTDLRKELESDALHAEMESRIAKIDEAVGQGDSIDTIASNNNMSISRIGPIDRQGTFTAQNKPDALLTALAQNKDLLASLFELMEGETADLTEINENMYAIFSLSAVTPSRDRDFAETKPEIEKKWLAEQRASALTALVENITTALARKEKTFEQAAKDAGVVVKTARDVSRESKVAGLNDPVALTRLFDETDLSAIVKVPTGNNIILAKVLDARIPEAGLGKATPESEKQWRLQSEQAITSLFVSDLLKKHDISINTKLLENSYGANSDADSQ